jgi:CRISPR-associated protein Cmr5
MSTNPLELRAHGVAREAYARVIARGEEAFKESYGSLAYRLPGMILQNGLAQATGFLLAKAKEEHRAILADLTDVMRKGGATRAADGKALHQAVIGADLEQTLRLTRAALEASGWIKRYVQGALGVEAGAAEGGSS